MTALEHDPLDGTILDSDDSLPEVPKDLSHCHDVFRSCPFATGYRVCQDIHEGSAASSNSRWSLCPSFRIRASFLVAQVICRSCYAPNDVYCSHIKHILYHCTMTGRTHLTRSRTRLLAGASTGPSTPSNPTIDEDAERMYDNGETVHAGEDSDYDDESAHGDTVIDSDWAPPRSGGSRRLARAKRDRRSIEGPADSTGLKPGSLPHGRATWKALDTTICPGDSILTIRYKYMLQRDRAKRSGHKARSVVPGSTMPESELTELLTKLRHQGNRRVVDATICSTDTRVEIQYKKKILRSRAQTARKRAERIASGASIARPRKTKRSSGQRSVPALNTTIYPGDGPFTVRRKYQLQSHRASSALTRGNHHRSRVPTSLIPQAEVERLLEASKTHDITVLPSDSALESRCKKEIHAIRMGQRARYLRDRLRAESLSIQGGLQLTASNTARTGSSESRGGLTGAPYTVTRSRPSVWVTEQYPGYLQAELYRSSDQTNPEAWLSHDEISALQAFNEDRSTDFSKQQEGDSQGMPVQSQPDNQFLPGEDSQSADQQYSPCMPEDGFERLQGQQGNESASLSAQNDNERRPMEQGLQDRDYGQLVPAEIGWPWIMDMNALDDIADAD